MGDGGDGGPPPEGDSGTDAEEDAGRQDAALSDAGERDAERTGDAERHGDAELQDAATVPTDEGAPDSDTDCACRVGDDATPVED
ncbi:MAG: hypothetical protein ABTD50_03655 [Polyangiaceae bacterium]|jgi:hypothetical protein